MAFITDDFLLSNKYSSLLFHECSEKLPIIDYHCHLNPREIAENVQFRDITQLWLVDSAGGRPSGDHYKWRAMRAAGVPEEYITGGAHSSWEIFSKWAETMPYAMRNPLYHWSHLELSRVFGIDKTLNPSTAQEIFEQCNAMLATEQFRTQALIRRFNVETICTTDDPVDDLRYHKAIALKPFGTKVLPAWRPDKAMAIESPKDYITYIEKLSEVSDIDIRRYSDLQDALQKRHDYFESVGCKLSDHGLDTFYADDYTPAEIEAIFSKVLRGVAPDCNEISKFRSAFLFDQAVMDANSSWVQQFHVGPNRNNNSRMYASIGPDTGFDAIDDKAVAAAGHRFFDRLDSCGRLAKTILYCLNPKDNAVMTAMAYTFNDGSTPGKMQLGSGWWFLDNEDGMRAQMNVLSNLGLLSRFVGMLTDSRSFISYPRHEYFRRIMCDLIGSDLQSGRLPLCEFDRIKEMVSDISYNNAKDYFNF